MLQMSVPRTIDIGSAASLRVQSDAAAATKPRSLVMTSAMRDQANGEPRQMCVQTAGTTMDQRLVNVGAAMHDSRLKKPGFDVEVDVVVEVGDVNFASCLLLLVE